LRKIKQFVKTRGKENDLRREKLLLKLAGLLVKKQQNRAYNKLIGFSDHFGKEKKGAPL